jgi:hypothetical protein
VKTESATDAFSLHRDEGTALASQLDPAQRAIAGAAYVSAVRCLFTYVVLPAAAPTVGVIGDMSLPFLIAAHALGTWMSARALHRCWQSQRFLLASVAAVLLVVNLMAIAGLL